MTSARLEKLHASLRTSGLDAVAINPGPTLTYLTGLHFHLMERPVPLISRTSRPLSARVGDA
jgi:Xaa-Pro dipeptidase